MTAMAFTRPERARSHVDFDGFDCGEPVINGWLNRHGNASNKNGSAALYLSYHKDTGELAGAYTLSSTAVVRSETNAPWMRRNAPMLVPAVLLGQLAVARQYQHQGLAKALVRDAVDRTLQLGLHVGVRALVVDPLNATLTEFYGALGFEGFAGEMRMYFRMPNYPQGCSQEGRNRVDASGSAIRDGMRRVCENGTTPHIDGWMRV